MANCNDLFLKFHEEIVLNNSKRDNLKSARNAIRNRIKKHFKDELKDNQPDFYQQGSFSLKTTVNPIDGEYDIDDGVYLNNLDEKDIKEWPKSETVHNWVKDAVKGHTKEDPDDMKSCIRVKYTGYYHVDLPIYSSLFGKIYLARRGDDQWIESDPKIYYDWFQGKIKFYGKQFRRNIHYLKAWNDYNSNPATGIIITVLAGNNHSSNEERDDKSLVTTTGNIVSYLESNKSLHMPVEPYDDLLSGWSESKITKLIVGIKSLRDKGNKALDEDDKDDAYKLWNSLFGDRFKNNLKKSMENNFEFEKASVVITTPTQPWNNGDVVRG